MLLVLGVFLGIQVSNWNAARQEHVLEAEYLARLQRDFTAIDARLAINVPSWQKTTAAPIHLLADLDAFRQSGAWPRAKADMLVDASRTMGSRIPSPRVASYVELLSAGKLGLIRDTRLRDALSDYDTQAGFTMTAYDTLVQRVDPYRAAIVAHLRFDRSIDGSNVDPQELLRNGTVVWSDIDLAQLAADPDVPVALNMFANASFNQLLNARMQQEKARAVLAILKPGTKRVEGGQP
ncbi:MAG: hypothetical protein QM719_01790 [Thermomonas sp.]